MTLHQLHYMQAARGNISTTESYLPQTNTPESNETSSSLLKDVLLHGKQIIKQNYYAHLRTNTDAIPCQSTSSNEINSHNPYHSDTGNLTSPTEIIPTAYEYFFGNLQEQFQQQQYNEYSQNHSEHTMQPYNCTLLLPGSTQPYNQTELEQQAILNVQESRIHNWTDNGKGNDDIRRNNNIETFDHNNGQGELDTNNITDYPWMRRTNANQRTGAEQKRTRQTYTRIQIFELEKEFCSNKYLAKRQRMDIAKKVNLTERQVKIWFQNRRMKEKKGKSVSPTHSFPTATSTTSQVALDSGTSNTQMMFYEKQASYPTNSMAQQTQLESQQQFHEEQRYINNNQSLLPTHYLNKSVNNNSYENTVMRHIPSTGFVNCSYRYPTT